MVFKDKLQEYAFPAKIISALAVVAVASLVFVGLAIRNGSSGEVISAAMDSDLLNREFVYQIYLPDGYNESEQSYPVLYLLHGSNGTESSWLEDANLRETADSLIARELIKSLIIVTPTDPSSWWLDGPQEQVQSSFIQELLPHIDANYRTISSRQGRAIGGYSAGGFGAANIALLYPELFAAAAPLSPAVYSPEPSLNSAARSFDAFLTDGEFDVELWQSMSWISYIDDYKEQDFIVPFYINSGDHDRLEIAYHAAVFYQALRDHQPELVELRIFDGDHNFAAWGGSIDEAMIYMDQFLEAPR